MLRLSHGQDAHATAQLLLPAMDIFALHSGHLINGALKRGLSWMVRPQEQRKVSQPVVFQVYASGSLVLGAALVGSSLRTLGTLSKTAAGTGWTFPQRGQAIVSR